MQRLSSEAFRCWISILRALYWSAMTRPRPNAASSSAISRSSSASSLFMCRTRAALSQRTR